MTKIVIPDDLTIFHSEAKRLQEERDSMELQRNNCMLNYEELRAEVDALEDQLAAVRQERDKVRDVNAEQAKLIAAKDERIAYHVAELAEADESWERINAENESLREQLRQAQQRMRVVRSGE